MWLTWKTARWICLLFSKAAHLWPTLQQIQIKNLKLSHAQQKTHIFCAYLSHDGVEGSVVRRTHHVLSCLQIPTLLVWKKENCQSFTKVMSQSNAKVVTFVAYT